MLSVKKYLSFIYIKIKENPLFLLLTIALIVRFQYAFNIFFTQGSFPKTNDSYWYIDHANELIQRFSIELGFNGIFYISYYSVVALFQFIFRNDSAVILFQVLLNAITVIPLFKTAEALLNKRTAIITSLIYIFMRELKYWSVFLLTDSIFISNIVFLIYSYTFFELTKKKKFLYLSIANAVYMILLRPAGTITVCFLIIFIIVKYIKPILKYVIQRKKTFILILVGIIPYISLAVYFVLKSELGLSFFWNLKWLIFKNYGAGQIFDIPTIFDHKYKPVINHKYFDNFVISFFINNFYHIAVIYAKRFIFLWGEMWIWSYHLNTFSHTIDYIRRCIPLVLSIWGMLRVIFRKKSDISLVLFVPIISTVIFCVIFFLDSGWRYRLPSLPFIAIFMAYGIEYLLTLVLNVSKTLLAKRKSAGNRIKEEYLNS